MINGEGSTTLMNHDRYFAIVNMHTFLGDTISTTLPCDPMPIHAHTACDHGHARDLEHEGCGLPHACTAAETFSLQGRKVAYYYPSKDGGRMCLGYIAVAVFGAILCLLKMPILLWPGLFLIFYANGSIYATTTKHIDDHVPDEFNLIALSVWLFVGDIGSVTGSNTWEFMQPLLCDGALGSHPDWKYFCILEN